MNASHVLPEYPWTPLESVLEVESWMELHNQELQNAIGTAPVVGQGICFSLSHGGEVYLHTNQDGDVMLDVTPEASWVVPLITAITSQSAPRGQYWMLPGHVLVQLIFGLNSLIASSRLVLRHEYKRPA